jgi:hypothetical protein
VPAWVFQIKAIYKATIRIRDNAEDTEKKGKCLWIVFLKKNKVEKKTDRKTKRLMYNMFARELISTPSAVALLKERWLISSSRKSDFEKIKKQAVHATAKAINTRFFK